ncbi:MAG: purine-nucleoside phosphorylase [Planctomycetia bacterium]|nr:purine-nucleoside phosphorylase [Planctomycetia bacterium]
MNKLPLSAVQQTLQQAPPRIAVVLGSGLSVLAECLQLISQWSFVELPGMVASSIQGHRGQLLYGTWNSIPVLMFAGRIHYYEGHGWDATLAPIRLAADLGIERLILTNAAGGIREGFKPGTLMLIQHHLKCTQPRWWAKGVQKSDPIWYDYQLNDKVLQLAGSFSIPLEYGFYACLTGPSYETPAEIRMLQTLGISAVGMSTALEAEEAYQRKIQTIAISCITNVGAGLSATPPHHEEVMLESQRAAHQLGNLLEGILTIL